MSDGVDEIEYFHNRGFTTVDLATLFVIPCAKLAINGMLMKTDGRLMFKDRIFCFYLSLPDNAHHQIHFNIDQVVRILVPPMDMYEGAFFLLISLNDVGYASVYDKLRSTVFPEQPENAIDSTAIFVCETFYNWRKDGDAIKAMLRYFDCAKLCESSHCAVIKSDCRMLGFTSFVSSNVLLNILGQAGVEMVPCISNLDGLCYYRLKSCLSPTPVFNFAPTPVEVEPFVEVIEEDEKSDSPLAETYNFNCLGLKKKVNCHQLMRISHSVWLSDTDIHFFFEVMMAKYLSVDQRKKFYVLSPESSTLIFGDGFADAADKEVQKRIDRVVEKQISKFRSKETHILDAEYIIAQVPCNRHHSLFVIVNPAGAMDTIHDDKDDEDNVPCKMICFNSMDKAIPPWFAEKMFGALKALLSTIYNETSVIAPGVISEDNIETHVMKCPQQVNTIDCGIYVIKFFELFLQDLPDDLFFFPKFTDLGAKMFANFTVSRNEFADMFRNSLNSQDLDSIKVGVDRAVHEYRERRRASDSTAVVSASVNLVSRTSSVSSNPGRFISPVRFAARSVNSSNFVLSRPSTINAIASQNFVNQVLQDRISYGAESPLSNYPVDPPRLSAADNANLARFLPARIPPHQRSNM